MSCEARPLHCFCGYRGPLAFYTLEKRCAVFRRKIVLDCQFWAKNALQIRTKQHGGAREAQIPAVYFDSSAKQYSIRPGVVCLQPFCGATAQHFFRLSCPGEIFEG